jgi:crotonobetainyl-CoA:carnitine CoA-transferase CaiB-like acyl-CoA transferase
MSGRPLDGFRVIDFTHAAAGPYATLWLADLGAEIIKIEKPGRGDGARYMGEPMLGPKDSDYYVSLNADKKSLLLDLQKPEAVEIAKRLIVTGDLVISNFRPGVMERLGLGFDDVKGLRQGLVVCSISAFGQEGSWRDRPANDIIMQGFTGMMDITGEPEGDPVRVGVPISDYSTGLFALSGVLAALLCRDRFPEGQHVEVSMFNATTALMANYVPSVLDLGKDVPRMGRGHPQIVPYQAFRCGDGGSMIVGAFTTAFWRRLATGLGHEEWITDPRFESNAARVENRHILVPLIEAIFETQPRDHWAAALKDFDVPFTPVNSAREAFHTEQGEGTVHALSNADGSRKAHVSANPARSKAWTPMQHALPPQMGDHSVEILTDLLGMTHDQIDDLAGQGVVGKKEYHDQ